MNTVNPLSNPWGAYFFQTHLIRGLIEMWGLFYLTKLIESLLVSVFHKELEYKVEKLKY